MIDSILTFRCQGCAQKLRLRNYEPGDAIPNCLNCGIEIAAPRNKLNLKKGKAPSRGGSNTARAVDITYQNMSDQFGITDMRDGLKEGETAAPKLTPMQDQMAKAWAQNQGAGVGGVMGQSLVQAARANEQAAKARGEGSVVEMFHKQGTKGKLPDLKQMTHILGRA